MKYLKCNRCGKSVSNKPVAESIYLKEAGIYCDDKNECERHFNYVEEFHIKK